METKMITIPFDAELAKKIQASEHPGKIVTRDGKDVRVLCFDAKRGLPIIVLLTENDRNESLQAYKSDGNYYGDGEVSRLDLVLQVPEWTQFKDGDVIYCEYYYWPNDCDRLFVVLDGKIGFTSSSIIFNSYVSCDCDSKSFTGVVTYNESYENADFIRLATDEEKQKFINRLKEEPLDKAHEILKRYFDIEKVEEKSMYEVKSEVKCEFKPYNKVLVRSLASEKWQAAFFSHYDKDRAYPYVTTGSCSCAYCIPYNEKTKHLVDSTDNWEGK